MPISLHLFFFIRYTVPLQAEIDFAAKKKEEEEKEEEDEEKEEEKKKKDTFLAFLTSL